MNARDNNSTCTRLRRHSGVPPLARWMGVWVLAITCPLLLISCGESPEKGESRAGESDRSSRKKTAESRGVSDSSGLTAPLKSASQPGLTNSAPRTPVNPGPQVRECDLTTASDFSKLIASMGNQQLVLAAIDKRIALLEQEKLDVYRGDWRIDYSDYSAIFAPVDQKTLRRLELARLLNYRGTVNTRLNRLAEAEADFRKAISYFKKCSKTWANLATMLQKQNRMKEAIAAAETACQINPKYTLALSAKVEISEALGRTKDVQKFERERKAVADENLKSSVTPELMDMGMEILPKLKQMPPSPVIDNSIGLIYWQFRRYKEAADYFRKAMSKKPKICLPYYSMGWVASMEGKNAEAVKYFESASEIDKSFALAYLQKAYSEKALGRYDAAAESYSRFLKLYTYQNNLSAKARIARASCYSSSGQIDKAMQDLGAARAQICTNEWKAEALAQRAILLKQLGRKQEALDQYAQAISLNPMARYLKERGELSLSTGDFEGGMVDLSDSLRQVESSNRFQISPPSAMQIKELIAQQDRLIKLDPSADSSYYNRGVLRMIEGNHLLAISDFEKVLELNKKPTKTTDSALSLAIVAVRLNRKDMEAKGTEVRGTEAKNSSFARRQAEQFDRYLKFHGKNLSPELEFLCRRIKAQQAINKLVSVDDKTRGYTVIGLQRYAAGDFENARQLLQWVKRSGNTALDEFTLAVYYLPRCAKKLK